MSAAAPAGVRPTKVPVAESGSASRGWSGLLALSLLLWLLAAVAIPFFWPAEGGTAPEMLVGLAVALPFTVSFFSGTLFAALRPAVVAICLALMLSLLASTVGNPMDIATVLAILIVPVYIATSASFAFCNRSRMLQAFRLASLGTLATLVGAALMNDELRFFLGQHAVWERLSGGNHPNYYALTALVGALLAFSYRGFWRFGLIVAFFALSYLAQSRTAMLGILICLLFVGGSAVRPLATLVRRRITLFPLLLGCALVAVALAATIAFQLFANISSLGGRDISNLSGRDRLWAEALRLFSERPVFGYGYRSQSTLDLLGGFYSHNMWLSSLLEIGLIGTLVFAGAYGYAAWLALKHRREDVGARIALVTFVVYFVYGITEGRYINTGNPLSILFLFSIGYVVSYSAHQLRQATAAPLPPATRPTGSFAPLVRQESARAR